jgi:asparagine synthetase B (glutamine-hydrolysing)
VTALLGIWHSGQPDEPWRARLAGMGMPALGSDGMIVAGAARAGTVIAGVDGVLHRVGAREPVSDPAAALSSEWLAAGDGFLTGVRGDAAIVLWDPDRRRGLLARDQLGIGCLYLRSVEGCLAFATDIPSLLDLTGPAEPDPDGVACWLARAELPPGGTLYEGIARLPPGEALVFDGDRQSRWRYWGVDQFAATVASKPAPAEAVRDALVTAVRRRVPADGSAATLLSGGLDSTAVAAIAALGLEGGARSLNAYSAVFPGHPAQDESELIADTAAELGLHATALPVADGSVVAGAADWAERTRLPLPAPNWFYQRVLLERMAGEGITVALDGEGGDEVFGADPFVVADALRAGHPLRAVSLLRRFPGAGSAGPRGLLHFLTRYGIRGALSPARHAGLRRSGARSGPPWLAPWAAERAAELVDPWRWKTARRSRRLSHLVFNLTERAQPPASA